MHIKSTTEQTYRYYGLTTTGRKIHIGTQVEYSTHYSLYVVNSFCGVFMLSYQNGDMPPAHLADSFCRNCFRGEAWRAFQYQQEIKAATEESNVTIEEIRSSQVH